MKPAARPVTIVIADDDEDDCLLAREALNSVRSNNDIRFVGNGEELLEYLRREDSYSDPAQSPNPSLILLDLNMPRMGGQEALRIIKEDESLRHIPIIVLTTSRVDQDILESYGLGANSYIAKPVTFDGLVEVMQGIADYWLGLVELPPLQR